MSKQIGLFQGETQDAKIAASKGCTLLVEDDPVLRMMLRNMLESEGYEVAEAESRTDALGKLALQQQIAVAIVDLGLPPVEHTTFEGLALIRTMSAEYQNIKIIVLTGQDEEQSALEAIREGAFDFLSKPASSEKILGSVHRAFLFHRKEQDMMADGQARLQLNPRYTDGLKAVREEAEEKLVRQVLKETGFNIYKSAEKLGIKRESIYYFMKKFKITRDD
jgi:DNA-binding NtrC family response regulator